MDLKLLHRYLLGSTFTFMVAYLFLICYIYFKYNIYSDHLELVQSFPKKPSFVKSKLTLRHQEAYDPTIEEDSYFGDIELDSQSLSLEIHDTAGQVFLFPPF